MLWGVMFEHVMAVQVGEEQRQGRQAGVWVWSKFPVALVPGWLVESCDRHVTWQVERNLAGAYPGQSSPG